jgi:4-alpha-glucanotransferase
MSVDPALRRLAEAAGIEPGYWDVEGRFHEAESESLKAILAALGIPASDEAAAGLALGAIESADWRALTPPAAVVREGDPCSLAIHVARGGPAGQADWRVALETGEVMSGVARLADLPVEAARALGKRAIERRRLRLPPLPLGYHRLRVEVSDAASETSLIVVPTQCWLPADLREGRRRWGVSAQLYGLRSSRNWGVGDFADLEELAAWAGSRGADLIGLNPLHARFPREPARASPYYPSSRLRLDPLYLDVEALPDWRDAPYLADFARNAAAARSSDLVDYQAASTLKYAALEEAHARFRNACAQGDARVAEFHEFKREGARPLFHFALHEAIAETQGSYDWTHWPQGLRSAAAADVSAFAAAHKSRVEFFQYLQWQTELQLAAASRRTRANGMTIGLYRDLAVGSAPDGADVWSEPGLYALGAELGAPPDPFNSQGQAWGVPPLNPSRLRQSGYALFVALVRANMRHAGALRIDHVMGLQRLFWIPSGAPASAGLYVRYPLEDLLGILALESHRNRCVVVGEDLGTMPEGFRPRMERAGVLSCRVLYFEREGEACRRPADYPVLAAACVATHDLPTLRGFWGGGDLVARAATGQFATDDALAQAQSERRREKRALLEALRSEGLLAADADLGALGDGPLSAMLAAAAHAYVAKTPSILAMAQLEDLTGEERQANLPGAASAYPSWRRRLPMTLAELAHDRSAAAIVAAIASERPRAAEVSPTA